MVGGIENEGESMPRTRKSHPPSLKAKVAVEAIKAHKTTAQIARIFGVHPTQVGRWKRWFLQSDRPAPGPTASANTKPLDRGHTGPVYIHDGAPTPRYF